MANKKRISFSERNGYVKPSKVFILKKVTPEVSNAICSALMRAVQEMDEDCFAQFDKIKPSERLSQYIWSHFWNESILGSEYDSKHCWGEVLTWFKSNEIKWYYKIDFVEFLIDNLRSERIREKFIGELNDQFESLNFGYRIVNGYIVDVVSKHEIESIEDAIDNSSDQVRHHIGNALSLYSKRPEPAFANSIKESISAVEAQLRNMTGGNTFGEALNILQKSSSKIHPRLKDTLDKLYAYTNQPDTGARHSRMDLDSEFSPSSEEAMFMLVTCSAAVNYLKTKVAND